MKRSLIILAMMVLALLPLRAQERTAERTYVTTDRSVYVAGDRIWCSAFCVTGEGRLSDVSRVAYLELHSADGMAATAKLALNGGRGAGYLDLPTSLPTGNYRLVAYTAQNKDEVDYDYTGLASKTLSIFNVFSTDRVTDGVEVVSPEEYSRQGPQKKCHARPDLRHPRPDRGSEIPGQAGNDEKLTGYDETQAGYDVELTWSPDSVLHITNNTGSPITFSLSVAREDDIISPTNPDIAEFLSAARTIGQRNFRYQVLPELEGEVITGRVVADAATLRSLLGHNAYLSTPSENAEVYTSLVVGDGALTFITGNFFGNQELVCEIEGADPKAPLRIELNQPFVKAPTTAPDRLLLSHSLEASLKARSLAMQQAARQQADTLYEYLPRWEYPLFDGAPVRYILDDYTRFDTMEETFIEFIPQVRVRKGADGRPEIQVRLEEAQEIRTFTGAQSLVLLDGVPIFDHERLLLYDPHKIQSIDVYPYTHYLGSSTFAGAVNLITFEHNLPHFALNKTMQIVPVPGLCWPTAWLGPDPESPAEAQDCYQTLFWHPLLQLGPGETLTVPIAIPASRASVSATLEGMTSAAQPVVDSLPLFY